MPDVESDTMPLIINKAKRTAWQTRKLASYLKGASLAETLRKDSDFILKYIRYEKDDQDHEQIRSPRKLIYEGKGDCDCFAVCLATLLINQKINFYFRIAQYDWSKGQWAHIYIAVPKDQSNSKALNDRRDYIVLDPVTNQHDHEVAFSRKRDYNMALQFLDGPFARKRSYLGDCESPSAASSNASTTASSTPASKKPIEYASVKDLTENYQAVLTTDLLEKSGISYQHNIDENNNPEVLVNTPAGTVSLPTVMDQNTASQLLTNLTSALKQTNDKVTTAVKSLTAGQIAGLVVALIATGFAIKWAFSGPRKAAGLGSPTPSTRKKVSVLHI